MEEKHLRETDRSEQSERDNNAHHVAQNSGSSGLLPPPIDFEAGQSKHQIPIQRKVIQRVFDYTIIQRAIEGIINRQGGDQGEQDRSTDMGHPSAYYDREMPPVYNRIIWNLYKALFWNAQYGETRFTFARSCLHDLRLQVDDLISHEVDGTRLLGMVESYLQPILDSENLQNEAAEAAGGRGPYPRSAWRRRGPRVGESLAGQTFYRTMRGGNERTAIRGPYTGVEYYYSTYGGHRGLQYFGRTGWRTVVDQTVARMVRDGEIIENSYIHRVAQGMPLLGEGGLSAINTYDRVIFTLGAGFAGGRLNRVLQRLDGSPAGNQVNALPHFSGLRFDDSQDIRFELQTIDRMVSIVQNSQFSYDFARAQIKEYIDRSGFGHISGNQTEQNAERAARNSRGDAISAALDPGVTAVANYLSHGAPRYTPNPVADLEVANRGSGGNISKAVAIILKLHARRIARDRTANPQLYQRYSAPSLRDRLPNKIDHFVDFQRRTDPGFRFDYAAAATAIPGIRAGNGIQKWGNVHNQPPAGQVYLEAGGRYYGFGS